MANKAACSCTSAGYGETLAYGLIKRLIVLAVLGSFVCVGASHAAQTLQTINASSAQCGNSHPFGIIYCIPLDVYNSQAAIANGTQIPAYFNAFNPFWSNDLTANVDNICFYDGNTGSCMPAWLEGNLTHYNLPYPQYFYPGNFNELNISLLYWIKIDAPIPNGLASNEFYIGIFNQSTDEYGVNGILGANPVFYCSSGCPSTYYGGADNGQDVFNLYDNFEGNYSSDSNSSVIDSSFSAQNATWTVDNGLTFTQINDVEPVPYTTPPAIIYMHAKAYAPLDLSQDLSIDEDISPFYGREGYITPFGPLCM